MSPGTRPAKKSRARTAKRPAKRACVETAGREARKICERDFDAPIAGAAIAASAASLTLHELFAQQVSDMLDRADIDEEQKQGILCALACPCCGAGAVSFSLKLKPRS